MHKNRPLPNNSTIVEDHHLLPSFYWALLPQQSCQCVMNIPRKKIGTGK
jgi:hypothetical protein